MGLFDYIIYQDKQYQTKDTPDQFMETYEIRENELWYRKTNREWFEDKTKHFNGYLKEVSHEWKFLENYDGLICFYGYSDKKYIEYKALFMDGKLLKIKQKET